MRMRPTIAAYFRRVAGSLGVLSQDSGAYGACRLPWPSPRHILVIVWLATVVVWRNNLVRQAGHDDRVSFVHRSRVRWNKVRCVLLAFGHAFSSEIETMMGCRAIGIVTLRT